MCMCICVCVSSQALKYTRLHEVGGGCFWVMNDAQNLCFCAGRRIETTGRRAWVLLCDESSGKVRNALYRERIPEDGEPHDQKVGLQKYLHDAKVVSQVT